MTKRFYIIILLTLSILPNSIGNWQVNVDSLQALITKDSPDSVRARLHTEIADELLLNKPEDAYQHILEIISIAEKNADSTLLYTGYTYINTYFLLLNDYQSSLEFIYKAFELSENNKSQKAYCHSLLSEIFYFTDDLEKSF